MASNFDGLQVFGSVQGNFTCMWTIEGFSLLDSTVGKYHESGTFQLGEKGMDWFLALYPGGIDETNTGYISCFLDRNNRTADSLKLKFNLSLRNTDGLVLFDGMDNEWEDFTKCGYGYPEVMKTTDLIPKLVNDILVVTLEATYCATCVKDGVQSYESAEISPPVSITENLLYLWRSEENTDCVICVEGKKIRAHSIILSTHSKVFAAMFNHNTTEKQTRRVKIIDFGKDTMNVFLEFLYSGAVHNMNFDRALDLLRASDKYEVEHLKLYCSNYLMSILNSANVCRVLACADMHNAGKLRSHAIEHICENLSEHDLEDQRLIFEEQPRLHMDILKRFIKKRRIWKTEDNDN